MNHGSVVNTLLGMLGNNATTVKTTTPKAREDSAERFQDAMQKARPEVAAREPVAAKRPEAIKHKAAPEREKTPQLTNNSANRAAAERSREAQTQTAQGKAAHSEHAAANKQSEQTTQSGTGESDTAADANVIAKAGTKTDSETSTSAAGSSELQLEAGLSSSEDEALIVENPLPGLLVNNSAAVGDLGLGLTPLAQTVQLESATDSALEVNSTVLVPLLSAELAPELEGVALAATGASANLVQAAGLMADAKTMAASLPAGADMDLDGMVTDSLTTDAVATDTVGDTISSDTEAPVDELLTNTKTAFGKLLEASFATANGDKALSTPEALKPAPTVSNPALDVLTRLSEAQTSPAARAFVVQTGVPVTVGQPQWSQAVGDKVLWLAAQNVSAAEIRLDPPDLGPMQVKVSVNQDQATVSFTSPHPIVREALDQQLNRLREMFAEQGLNLVNVDVSDKSFAQQEREKNESGAGASTNSDDDDELQPVAITSAINMRLVDHYA